jgi:hypothetical protein
VAAPASVPAPEPTAGVATDPVTVSELATLKSNVTQLQDEVAALRALLDRVVRDLGLPPA